MTIWTELLQRSLSKRNSSGRIIPPCSAAPKDLVLFAQDDKFWLMSSALRWIEQPETHDRQAIARLSKVRRSSVELELAMTANPINDVRLKTFPVRHISHQNALVLVEADQFRKVRGNAETAFIVHICGGHDSPMNLRFEKRNLHVSQASV